MKPETEIRNLKRELKEQRARADREERSARISNGRVHNAELEAKEWERRFDIAMSKIPDVAQPDVTQ